MTMKAGIGVGVSIIILLGVGVVRAADGPASASLNASQIRGLVEKTEARVGEALPGGLRFDPLFAEFGDVFRSEAISFDSMSELDQRRRRGYEAQFNLGVRNREAGAYDAAARDFITLLEKFPPEEYRKKTMLQLALIAELQSDWPKAQQIYRHFKSLWQDDPNVPLVSLRLAEIYREMGADELALSDFHTLILSTVRSTDVKGKYFPVYERIVLKAKIEIANTHFQRGDYANAARYFNMLLRDETLDGDYNRANVPIVRHRLCECYSMLPDRSGELDGQVEAFLKEHAGHELEADVRYLAVQSCQKRQKTAEALEHMQKILELQSESEQASAESRIRWKLRVGLEVAAQMFQSANYRAALEIYRTLLKYNDSPEDELFIWYQIGVISERLGQYDNASEVYQKIKDQLASSDSISKGPPVKLIDEMTDWRVGLLDWYRKKQLVLEGMKEDNASGSEASND